MIIIPHLSCNSFYPWALFPVQQAPYHYFTYNIKSKIKIKSDNSIYFTANENTILTTDEHSLPAVGVDEHR